MPGSYRITRHAATVADSGPFAEYGRSPAHARTALKRLNCGIRLTALRQMPRDAFARRARVIAQTEFVGAPSMTVPLTGRLV